jgi:hypothetical protein
MECTDRRPNRPQRIATNLIPMKSVRVEYRRRSSFDIALSRRQRLDRPLRFGRLGTHPPRSIGNRTRQRIVTPIMAFWVAGEKGLLASATGGLRRNARFISRSSPGYPRGLPPPPRDETRVTTTASASFVSCSTSSPGVAISRRSRTMVRMISILTFTGVGHRKTLDSIATPCLVNTHGRFRRPPRRGFDVALCDIRVVRRNTGAVPFARRMRRGM